MDKWSPTNLAPLDKWSLEYSICLGGQAVGMEIWEPKWLGTICPRETNFWGPFVHETEFVRDNLSRGTGILGPEVWGSNGFGTKCVPALFYAEFNNLS